MINAIKLVDMGLARLMSSYLLTFNFFKIRVKAKSGSYSNRDFGKLKDMEMWDSNCSNKNAKLL